MARRWVGDALISAPRRRRFWIVWGKPLMGLAVLEPSFLALPRLVLWSVALPKQCQSLCPRFFLPDSDAPFSSLRRLRFWYVFDSSPRSIPLYFDILKGLLRSFVFSIAQAYSFLLWPKSVALPKHSLLTIPYHPNR